MRFQNTQGFKNSSFEKTQWFSSSKTQGTGVFWIFLEQKLNKREKFRWKRNDKTQFCLSKLHFELFIVKFIHNYYEFCQNSRIFFEKLNHFCKNSRKWKKNSTNLKKNSTDLEKNSMYRSFWAQWITGKSHKKSLS